jgi:hypothetical protein
MRSFGVLVLFLASIFCLAGALNVQAESKLRIEPGLSAPVPFLELSKKPKPDGGTREEDEEELRGPGSNDGELAVLEMVDPSVLDNMIRVRHAVVSSKQ